MTSDDFLYGSGSKAQNTTTPAKDLPSDEPMGALEPVAYFNGAMPTGVTVSHRGRIFVNFPKWGDQVSFTVSEIRDGKPVAYPDEGDESNQPAGSSSGTYVGAISRSGSGRSPMDS